MLCHILACWKYIQNKKIDSNPIFWSLGQSQEQKNPSMYFIFIEVKMNDSFPLRVCVLWEFSYQTILAYASLAIYLIKKLIHVAAFHSCTNFSPQVNWFDSYKAHFGRFLLSLLKAVTLYTELLYLSHKSVLPSLWKVNW